MLTAVDPGRKQQIFMTADAVGGVWQYALDLAHGLHSHGVETTLALLGPRPDASRIEEASAVDGLTLLPLDLPLDWTAATAARCATSSTSATRSRPTSPPGGASIACGGAPSISAAARAMP